MPEVAPAVSIVIPCHNSAPYLRETVASAVAQTLPELEIILVDDGSQDTTRELIRALMEKFPRRRMRAVFQQRAGVAAARNAGIALALGRYVLPLDGDDLIAPTTAEAGAALLDAEAEVALVYGDIEEFGDIAEVRSPGPFELARMKYFNQLPYCAVYRKAMWQAIGGYRPHVDGFDDWDFWIAAAGRGYAGRYLPMAFLRHRKRQDSQMASIIGDYDRLYASIIRNNREHYAPAEVAAAEALLAGGQPAPLFRATRFIFMNHYFGKLPARGRWGGGECAS
jgi:glycosyltransferase involved in cell wall biosynthesis